VTAASPSRCLAVGLIGFGAIGSTIADRLRQGAVPNARLTGVFGGSTTPAELVTKSLEGLVEASDVVVEAASQAAVADYGPVVKDSGRDLMVLSIGALVDDDLLDRLRAPSGGRLLLSTGACGGLDILRAANALGPLDAVSLRSSKPPHLVACEWMDEDPRQALAAATGPVLAFSGTAREAVRLFPQSANLSGLLALATLGFDRVGVEIWGDPGLDGARHEISARGSAGTYSVSIQNRLSPENPRTSAVTAFAVLRCLSDTTSHWVVGC
jgi:aspartate dehydrogenase